MVSSIDGRRSTAALAMVLLFAARTTPAFAQDVARKLNLKTGKEIFLAGCAGCHGPDGKGAPDTTVGFEKPETFPDFTKCDQTTPELDVDWRATIRDGGKGRGFSRIMPSFAEALTPEEIDLVIGYLRGFCKEKSWPRGEMNLPRPLITEKAFPEDEVILTTAINATGAAGVAQTLQFEKRFAARNNLEVAVPYAFSHDTGRWLGGIGDLSMGWKRVLASSLRTGSIVSVQGEVKLPTGDRQRGFGAGVTVFEGFAAWGQLLPANSFLQMQGGVERATHAETSPTAVYWRSALGKSLRQEDGVGRMWTPMVELTADRNLIRLEKTNWTVVPQFQVTLNRRQHIRANVGVSIPANNREGRSTQVIFYLLWDWFDGGLLEGWK
jgi:mono/diheme cytochrome c family protein